MARISNSRAKEVAVVKEAKTAKLADSWAAFSEEIKAAKVFSDTVDCLVRSSTMLEKASKLVET